jgi:phenylacetate-coenzyme A ligase PaaK-like adenylate-forming protein
MVEKLGSPHYGDFWWETADPKERDQVMLHEQAIPTVLFAKKKVPFYRKFYAHLSEGDILRIRNMAEFVEVIPHITKEHLTKRPAKLFVPELSGADVEIDPNVGRYWKFGTGGSTGKPAKIWHSMQDWRAFATSANRHIAYDFHNDPHYIKTFGEQPNGTIPGDLECKITPFKDSTFLGTYNRDHITNNIYARMLIALGADFEFRPSAVPTLRDEYDAALDSYVNGLLAPPGGGNDKKGDFLENFLKLAATDPEGKYFNHNQNEAFKFILWSSMPLDKGLYEYLSKDLRIPYIKGHFGSTEVCPTASTCSQNPLDFHLVYSHSLVSILNKNGHLAGPNEFGYTLVSKVGATDKDGNNTVPTGMIFINYMTGDGAMLSPNGQSCGCTRNTPVIYGMNRIDFHEGHEAHACKVNIVAPEK